MRVRTLALLVLLVSWAFALQARELIAQGRGTLQIDAAGRVEAVQLSTPHGAGIDEVLVARFRGWRFEPVVEQGRPVPVTAHMQYLLKATLGKDATDLQLSIHDVDFVDPPSTAPSVPSPYRKVQPPTYPRQMIAERFGAYLELVVQLDDQGTPMQVAPAGGWLLGRTIAEGRRQQKMDHFVRAAVKAVSAWRFDPPQPGHSRVSLPIIFTMSDEDIDQATQLARWTEAMRIRYPEAAWMVDLDAGTILALDADGRPQRRDLRLLTDPRG